MDPGLQLHLLLLYTTQLPLLIPSSTCKATDHLSHLKSNPKPSSNNNSSSITNLHTSSSSRLGSLPLVQLKNNTTINNYPITIITATAITINPLLLPRSNHCHHKQSCHALLLLLLLLLLSIANLKGNSLVRIIITAATTKGEEEEGIIMAIMSQELPSPSLETHHTPCPSWENPRESNPLFKRPCRGTVNIKLYVLVLLLPPMIILMTSLLLMHPTQPLSNNKTSIIISLRLVGQVLGQRHCGTVPVTLELLVVVDPVVVPQPLPPSPSLPTAILPMLPLLSLLVMQLHLVLQLQVQLLEEPQSLLVLPPLLLLPSSPSPIITTTNSRGGHGWQ
jgi:hypothetical protein